MKQQTARYFGSRRDGKPVVQRDNQEFRPPVGGYAERLVNVGWMWGGPCDGTYKLAYALLLDATDSFLLATALHIPFAMEVLSQFPHDAPWSLSQDEIEAWVGNFSQQAEAQEDWRCELLEDARQFYRDPPGSEGG